jgi:thiosulfate dehydrogenase (quinone) large subunit
MSVLTSRAVIYVLAAMAVISLALMVVPQIAPTGDLHTVIVWVFWISFIALTIALFAYGRGPGSEEVQIEGPGIARFLFNNRAAGLFWLPIRVFLGVSWLLSGAGKFGNPAWTNGGSALRGYWERVATIPEQGSPPITYEWYRDFINLLLNNNAESWFAWLIIMGEIAVGVGLILGALTGIAAFFGALMNMSFLLAGSASTNPVLFIMAIGLMLAWKVAGYYGLDRWLLPMLGTPWRPGAIFPTGRSEPESQSG